MTGDDQGPSDLLAARRAKLDRLRAEGIDPFPHDFPGVEPIAGVLAAHTELAAGEETSVSHRVAGRSGGQRGQGRAAFLDLVDRSGRIQLHARVDVLGDERFDRLVSLDLGDLIGVDGLAVRTRRGELSLRVDDFTLLAKSLRPPPDKHHGLTDTETRYRRRELDLIANEDVRRVFMTRARIIATVRRELDRAGFIEVETPVLQPLYGGAAARPFTTHHNALDRELYLRIATELYLKRLHRRRPRAGLRARQGLPQRGPLGQAQPRVHDGRVVRGLRRLRGRGRPPRADRRGRRRRARRPAADRLHRAMARVTLRAAILEQAGVDVIANHDPDSLAAAIAAAGLDPLAPDRTWPQMVDDLLSRYVEPTLIEPTFVMDYPLELSPFAKAHRTEPGLVERWEAYAGGFEIANAFTSSTILTSSAAASRPSGPRPRAGDEEAQPFDEAFLAALEQGMPPTGGVGVGIDRLVMAMTGRRSIREVVLFPAMRD